MIVYGTKSPRGYLYAGSGTPTGASAAVENVWGRYSQRLVPVIGHQFALEGICAMKHAIKDVNAWCLALIEDSRLSDRSLEFVIDSIKFAMTGKRVLPVMTWEALLTQSTSDLTSAKSIRIKMFDSLTIPSIEDLLSEWVKQPNGVADLLTTAKILFGNLK